MIYSIVAVLVLVLDQAVKFWTVKNIVPQAIGDECVNLIPGVIHMTNVQNSGAAFSILADQRWLLIAVSVLFIVGIIVLINMEIIHTKFGKWTAVLVMAGALGNAIDRVLYGYVVDMFELELFSFAVFNVADIFITVCGILFCIHVIFYREPEAELSPAALAARQREEGILPEDEDQEEDEPAPKRRRGKKARAAAEDEPAPRRRRDQKTQEDPYAAIPHRDRSAHRTLAEETAPADPEDPFGEWDFGDVVELPKQAAPAKRAPAAPEKPSPAAPARPEPAPQKAADSDGFSLEDILAEFRDS